MTMLSADQFRLAKRLATDAATAELARAFRERDTRWLLLKGPVVASRLYGDGTFRDYGDIDVLVAPSAHAAAAAVLEDLGYRLAPNLPSGEVQHALEWHRPTDHSFVDLHRYVPHLAAPPEAAWAAFVRDSEEMAVAGERVEVTGYPAFALLMALHALHHGRDRTKPLVDLERAVTEIPLQEWAKARILAAELWAERNLAAGLMLSSAGSRLREELDLPKIPRWERALRGGSVMGRTRSFTVVSRSTGARSKLRTLRREVFPTKETRPVFEKAYSSSSPVLIFLRRIGRVARKTPLVVAAWYLEKKDERRR